MSQPNPYASYMLQPGQTYKPGQIWNVKGRDVEPAPGSAGMTLADKMKEREALIFPYPEPKKMEDGKYVMDQNFSFNPMPDPMSTAGFTKYSSQDEHFTPISHMVDAIATSSLPSAQSSGTNVDVALLRYMVNSLKQQIQQMNNSVAALEAVLSTTN